MALNSIEKEIDVHSIMTDTLNDEIKEKWNNNLDLEKMKKSIIDSFIESHAIDDWSIEYTENNILVQEEDDANTFSTYDNVIEYYSDDIKNDIENGILDNDGYYDFYLNKEQLYYLGFEDEYNQQTQYMIAGVPNHNEANEEQQINDENEEIVQPLETKEELQNEHNVNYDFNELAKIIDNQLDISEVAREVGFDLEKNGRESFKTTQHSSLVLDCKTNRFFWNSQNISGGVVRFWMQFQNKSFKEAVIELKERVHLQNPEKFNIPVQIKEEVSSLNRHRNLLSQLQENNFSSDSNKKKSNVKAYLIKTRGIEPDVVQKMIQDKVLYQISDAEGRTQAAFVGRDEEGRICSVCRRSTSPVSKFKGDFTGCDYSRGWFYEPGCKVEDVVYNHQKPDKEKTLLVFESNIDMMSYMSLLKLTGKDYNQYAYLSCGSISKSQSVLETCKLYGYKKAFIMFDNDFEKGQQNPGLNRAIEVSKLLNEKGIQAVPLVPSKCNDWNDTLVAYKNKEIELNRYKESELDENQQKSTNIFQKLKNMKEHSILVSNENVKKDKVPVKEQGIDR